MHAAGKFIRASIGIDHAMALDPALAVEGLRHDIDAEMRLRRPAGARHGLHAGAIRLRLAGFRGAKASVNFSVMRSAVRMTAALSAVAAAGQCRFAAESTRFAPLSSLEGIVAQRRIMSGHEIRLTTFRSHPRQAATRTAGRARPAAGLRMAGLRRRRRRHRAPEGPRPREGVLALLPRPCARIQPVLQFLPGMSDDAVAAYQKDALTGHRPTWKMGNRARRRLAGRFPCLRQRRRSVQPVRRRPASADRQARAETERRHDPQCRAQGARHARPRRSAPRRDRDQGAASRNW